MAITISGSKYGALTLASAGTLTATITGTNFVSGDFTSTRLLALFNADGTERLTNGTFTTDTNWTKGGGVTISGGVVNASSASLIISQSSPSFTAGKYYTVSIAYTQTAGAKLRFGTGTTDGANVVFLTGTIANGSGTITFSFRAASTTTGFYIGADTAVWSGTLDNFTITPVGEFKGIAWARRHVSTSQLQLQSEFFHPITGAVVTQVTGDSLFVSKNFSESVVSGLTVTNKVVACTTADDLTFGLDDNPKGVCFYDENKEIQNAVATRFSGGVAIFGKLESFTDGTVSSSCDWYLSGSIGTNSYGIRTVNLAAVACLYGGSIDGNRANIYYIGGNAAGVGGGTGGTILLFHKVQNVFDFASPDAGGTWGVNAANHVLRDCISITTATNAIMVRWGDGVVSGGVYKFPNNTSAPLAVFGSDIAGTVNISAPSTKRLVILDPGATAISGNNPQLVRSNLTTAVTFNFTNLITPMYGLVIGVGGSANSSGIGNYYFSDAYTNVQSASVGVVTLDADSSVVDSVASTGTTWQPTVYRRKYTGLTQNFVRGPWTYGIKKYGYNPVSGAIAASNYAIDGGYTADNVAFGGIVNQIADAKITLSLAAANALSSLTDLCELYDSLIAWSVASVTNAQYPSLALYPVVADGLIFNLTSRNLVLDAGAGSTLAVNTGTNVITAKASSLATCAKFDSVKTTGYITGAMTTGGAYTYTNGTLKAPTNAPTCFGGTLDIGAAGAYGFSVGTGTTIVRMTPTATGAYNLLSSHTGTLDLRNQSGTHAITVRVLFGTTVTTASNGGAAITVQYYTKITHTVKVGATPVASAVVGYWDDTNTDRTYSASFVPGALTADGSGVVTGYVLCRVNGTTYTGINVHAGKPGYLKYKVPVTPTGVDIASDLLLTTDPAYAPTPSTGTSINFASGTITQAGNATTPEVYDYYVQQWFTAANLFRDQIYYSLGTSYELLNGCAFTLSSGTLSGSPITVDPGTVLNVSTGAVLACGANVAGTLNAASPSVLVSAINMQGGVLDFANLTSYQMSGSFASGTIDLDSLSAPTSTDLDLRNVTALGSSLTVKNDSNANITVTINSVQTAPTLNVTGPGTGTLTLNIIALTISVTGMPTTGTHLRLQISNETGRAAPAWQATTAYTAGQKVRRTSGIGSESTAGLYFVATTAGTSGGSEPTWNTTVGATTNDGSVVWTCYAVLYYNANPGAASYTSGYYDGRQFLTGDSVRIRFAALNAGTSFSTFSTTIPATATGFGAAVSVTADAVYAVNAINGGSAGVIAKFTADYANNQLDLDADLDFSLPEAFAYFCYELTQPTGMYFWWGGVSALDASTYRNNVGAVSIFFDETTGFVKQTDNARWYRSDGVRPALDPTTGGCGIEINWRNPVFVTEQADIAAIKAKTDQLTFSGSNVNANVEQMNTAEVIGTGTTGDAWRGVGVAP